jgi:NADH:ubiquinone oxidoreductase subunit 6 (subunit J)
MRYGSFSDWLLCFGIIIMLEARIPQMPRNPEGHNPRWWRKHPEARPRTVPEPTIKSLSRPLFTRRWLIFLFIAVLLLGAMGECLSLLQGFWKELAWLAWYSFLKALGDTALGFFVQNIEYFFATLLATHLVIWFIRGRAKMRSHAAENLLIGVVVYCIVLITIFVPIYCYHLFSTVPKQIWEEAEKNVHPIFVVNLGPPPDRAYQKQLLLSPNVPDNSLPSKPTHQKTPQSVLPDAGNGSTSSSSPDQQPGFGGGIHENVKEVEVTLGTATSIVTLNELKSRGYGGMYRIGPTMIGLSLSKDGKLTFKTVGLETYPFTLRTMK